MRPYVEQRNGGFYIAGTRVSLDSVISRFNDGASPESIFGSFPMAGSLENIYGALTFYLANREVVDQSLAEHEQAELEMKQSELPESVARKLAAAREAPAT